MHKIKMLDWSRMSLLGERKEVKMQIPLAAGLVVLSGSLPHSRQMQRYLCVRNVASVAIISVICWYEMSIDSLCS